MKKKWLNKAYRHIHRYTCTLCGRLRLTLSNERRVMSVCTKCQPEKVNPDQATLL